MKLKRLLALALSLCVLFSLTLSGGAVFARGNGSIEELSFQKLDGKDHSIDLTREDLTGSGLVPDREDIDENETVKVIIVMEGDSIIESDSKAVLNGKTLKQAAALEASQAGVVTSIEKKALGGKTLDISYSYTWLLNGVAAQVPYGTIEAIKAIDGVKQVLLQPVYGVCQTETGSAADPMTAMDGVMVGRENTWAQGYTGEGMKIAIVDTGIDTDHQNFQALGEDRLTADSATRDTVSAVLEGLNASHRYSGLTVDDVYYSSKIAFGFNYCDNTLDITHDNDGQGDHGTHVAGIAAANKVDSSDVVGVAPDAQLYVMKVFGQNGGAYAGDILAALEDALILGADVVNMSLGSAAGFTSDGEAIDAIYNRVAQTNTVLAVSAGNAFNAGYANNWGTNANLTANPDNAVVGSPGTYNNVLSVASVENWKILSNYIEADGYQIAYVEGSNAYNEPLTALTGEYGFVAVPGVGGEADYEGLDVTGKVVLVQRGVLSFAEKCDIAANAGAVACIVYNNTTGSFGMDLTGCESGIPCVSIAMAAGSYLISALEADPALTLSFPAEQAYVPSPDAYRMSSFSSWGTAPDLSLEPDITAPGGNIYSTLNGGQYGPMSGTSMAAPNVAGMSALVMQYVKEHFDAGTTDYRTLVRQLLMSTSVPLAYDAALFYSPRSQGSGLANAFNAVSTQTYLTVDGCDVPKAELGHDPERTGAYSYTFNVTNFGGSPAFYDLNTVAQTEDHLDYDGVYFMSGTPLALSAAVSESSAGLVLTHDVDGSAAADSNDAYLIYQAAVGNAPQEDWAEVSFRYDTDRNEAVDTDDVQAYLDALVGNSSDAELTDTVLEVEAGQTAQVSVSVTLSEADRTYLDTYYTNGGYVEGFTFLTARNAGGVDLSLPYLAFYGDWTEPPVLDDGYYWDIDFYSETAALPGNQYPHFLFTEYEGEPSSFYPGVNLYVEEPFDISHVSLSTNGDGYVDTIDDMYISLLRNAASLTFRYTNTQTGEVYYEQTVSNASKSVYSEYYGQIVPFVYSWIESDYGLPMYDWKAPDGSELTNNTKLLLEVEATGVYGGEETETWQVPITIDLEAPTLLGVRRIEEDGSVLLELTFRDNLSASVVALLNGDGTEIYEMNGVEDVEPDAEGYQNYTVTYDITGISDKLTVVLSDYALNESYYGLNAGGAGTPYGDLVGFQYDAFGTFSSWVSFDADVEQNETTVFVSDENFVCAEYVNGYVFAQTETGALYGFRYADMLADTLVLEDTYIAQLENVYQDLAYSYSDGKLYGLYVHEDDWGVTSYINSINLNGEYYDEEQWMNVLPYQEDWAASRDGLYGLTLACDDAGNLYVMGLSYEDVLNEETGEWETVESDAQLWLFYPHTEWGYTSYMSTMVGETGLTMDFLQSMTWDHNTETLYWARFAPDGLYVDAELMAVDPETAECTKVGTLSNETCALFAPLTAESAAKEEHGNVPAMDSSAIGRPILRDDTLTLNLGGVKTLAYDLDPWYTDHKAVVWSSSNTDAVTVDETGTVTAVGQGSAVITVAAQEDETLFDTVTVEVTALDLKLEGIISAQGAGLGNVLGVGIYEFTMEQGIPAMNGLNRITASEELNFGLSLSASAAGRGSVWACESGNTGMIYEIDPATGEVKDVLQPIDGDMLFGMTYNETMDSFTGIMNMYLYVDQPFTHWAEEQIIGSYDEAVHEYTWRKVNMLPYLLESNTGFVTGETGQGASSEIVFCGITAVDGGIRDSYGETYYYDTYKDYLGNWAYSGMVNYQPTQTLVLLDNVGRLWYIDEIAGMTKTVDEWGSIVYTDDAGSSIEFYDGQLRNGMFDVEIVDEEGNVSYSVFNIRQLVETPLTDMFREGTMPRITYHFSDIAFAGFTAEGDPIFAMSLYDYWNNGTTNELFLYVPGHETDELDYETWEYIRTPDRLFSLGNTGENNIIATIHTAEVTGGLDSGASAGPDGIRSLTAGRYKS